MKNSLTKFSLGLSVTACAVALVAFPGIGFASPVPAPRDALPVILKGQLTDPTGAIVPGAKIRLLSGGHASREMVTDEHGGFAFSELPSGHYTISAAVPGFTRFVHEVEMPAGATRNVIIRLDLDVSQQRITVQDKTEESLDVNPTANAGALVLSGRDLDALPDDPDDLAADIRALAGPSAGPNGAEIFIDGFSGGHLPPKDSIREIRINQNPFSSEFDHVGFGRIEVFTKPGTDKLRGIVFFKFSDAALNSRNPYSSIKPPYQSRQFGGNVSGPAGKRASLFLDFEGRDIAESSLVNAITLDSGLRISPFNQAVLAPQRYYTFSPRLDYQINTANSMTLRYSFLNSHADNAGVGRFSLASHGYRRTEREHRIQLTETTVLSPRAINEMHFQYIHTEAGQMADTSGPVISVLDSFTGGASPFGHSLDLENRYEFQNSVSVVKGTHQLRVGGRLREDLVSDTSPRNFGGTFTFSGESAPQLDANNQVVLGSSGDPVLIPISSIERYRRTLVFSALGLTPSEMRRLGGGPSQFTIASGLPALDFNRFDAAVYVQDEWRPHPRLSISAGLRYETQNHLHDWTNFGPRAGFAWSPRFGQSGDSKTVIRGGSGIFYDRVGEEVELQSLRYNGITQRQFIVRNPKFFPDVLSLTKIEERGAQIVRRMDPNLRAPYTIQSAIGIERQLPFKLKIAGTFLNTRAVHLLRSRNITAPLPQAGATSVSLSPVNLYSYESTGFLNQNQFIVNVSRRFSGRVGLFGYYVYNRASSDTDGPNTFPSNQYDLRSEYGRGAIDIRHRVVIGGAVLAPFGVTFSPFLIARSGAPFNITTGRDASADTLFTGRPALATNLAAPGVVATNFGAFDLTPGPGEPVIARNFGEGPGFFTVNLRASRTFGFGEVRAGKKKRKKGPKRGGLPGNMTDLDSVNLESMFRDASTEHRYNVTLSVVARNLFNTVNSGLPAGSLSSPIFGRSNALASTTAPDGSYYGDNRRLQFQIRFAF